MLHEETTQAIIGASIQVLNKLKLGLDEKLYERALAIELRKGGNRVEQQRGFPVTYDGIRIGELFPDLIVNDCVIVETKVVDQFVDSHLAQVLGYLSITGLRVGLLLNFKHAKLGVKRVVR